MRGIEIGMNRIWWKRIAAMVVFLISLFVIDFILNRDNSEITTDMPKATLPVVSVLSENHKVNTMYGYISKREEAYTKDSITPISENREITIVIDTYQADIDSVAYEVRSIDGDRLIEGSDVSVYDSVEGFDRRKPGVCICNYPDIRRRRESLLLYSLYSE